MGWRHEMVRTAAYFVDVTIPGLSASDLVSRAGDVIQSTLQSVTDGDASGRRERAMRRGLRGLDSHQLRDLGLDRNAC
jgi:hypothetical protein